MCGWTIDEELNNTETFTFKRQKGNDFNEEWQEGPQTDHADDPNGGSDFCDCTYLITI